MNTPELVPSEAVHLNPNLPFQEGIIAPLSNPAHRPFTSPTMLTDLRRLPEVYRLRVFAWENSPGREEVNSAKYPGGYSDPLDRHSRHFVSYNTEGKIIGAARVSIVHWLEDLPYAKVFDPFRKDLPVKGTFLFYSRLVLHPDYRRKGLSQLFDATRIRHQMELGLRMGLVTVNAKRTIQLQKFHFQNLGLISGDPDPDYPFYDLNLCLLDLETTDPFAD